MAAADNFVYDSEGNLIEDKSERLKISYDWRGMPIEFTQYPPQENTGVSGDTLFRLTVAYDGTGRRISKTRWVKARGDAGWSRRHVTHYTGIGTEVRENFEGPAPETKVVVNMPQGLGRYGIENADHAAESGSAQTFEWYLKNHLGSTMLVYGTGAGTPGGLKAAYDYRSFGEQIELTSPSTGKVTENFTGKEKDDETQLNYFGARYLDPMLGMWISVDPARQFASPYLYAGNGVNPVNVVDPNGNYTLNLNEDNTVAGLVDDGNLNMVSVFNADGSLFGEYNAPPAESYFFTENLANQVFDPNMQLNADAMVKDATQYWPLDFWGWGTKGPFDFKNSYYFGAGKTVGVLNNTIMTARDAGNAIWGGWTRHMYLNNATAAALLVGGVTPAMLLMAGFCSTTEGQRLLMQGISNIVATKGKVYINGSKEDPSSAVMQDWGFDNYKP